MLKSFIMELPKISAPSFGVGPLQFIKEVKSELKKVQWPSQKEVMKMTSIVISVSIAVSLFISSLDFIFTKLTELLIKIK